MLSKKFSSWFASCCNSSICKRSDITVRGNVVDKTGPLVGVTVLVQGTETLVSTDLDGNFTIRAPSDGVLSFSSLGYKTLHIPINGRARLDVSMEEEACCCKTLLLLALGFKRKRT